MPVVTRGIGKILDGVLRYQKNIKGELVPFFREILDKPAPKSILVTCVDSRIVASKLLQAQPGAYFLVRNPGNFIPKQDVDESAVPSASSAAMELACVLNKANTVAVIGHSDSKVLNMLFEMRDRVENLDENSSQLQKWLQINGLDTVKKFRLYEKNGFKKPLKFSESNANEFEAYIDPDDEYDMKDRFSQINTLEQLKNVNNFHFLKDNINRNLLKGYALWLDVYKYEVHYFSYNEKRFIKINEDTYEKIYKESETEGIN